jgi:acetylornithine deacetylase/succinyl-diaminopimelate desuccinylase-like protein
VHVTGALAHSSTPDAGASAITGAVEAIRRVEAMRWHSEYPLLGGRHAVVYKVDFEPKLPHTLPASARFTVDRRMLPGDDPADAVREVLAAIGDLSPYSVTARPDLMMLPALVNPVDPGVRALQAAAAAVRGEEAPEMYRRGTFDAGGLARAGVPVVMFGCGGHGDWPAGRRLRYGQRRRGRGADPRDAHPGGAGIEVGCLEHAAGPESSTAGRYDTEVGLVVLPTDLLNTFWV